MTTLDSFRIAAVFLSCCSLIIVAAVIVLGLEASGVDAGLFKVVL